MRKNNLTSWSYTDSLECLLFFAQRMDELLFHHTTDTYRYSALSIRGLAAEYCAVYRDVNAGILNKKNLNLLKMQNHSLKFYLQIMKTYRIL